MAEASRDLAQGTIEVMVSESVCAKERMEAREVEEAYQKFEESEEHIKELLQRGAISLDEARRLRTRGKMHEQEDQDEKPKISSAVLAGADHKTNEQIIEEALKTKKQAWLIEACRKALRLDKLQNRIQIEKHKRSLPEYQHKYPFIHSMVKNGMTFELLTFFLVACNGVLTGVQISVKEPGRDLPVIYSALEEFFNVVFIVEILLRVMADGWTWFFATGNAVDVILIIVTGIIPTYILQGIFNVDSGELRIGQALRCVRLIRILKSVRTISAFRILWSLVSGIVDSGRILLWTLTIILVVLYMFSIFFVQLLVKSGLNLTPDQTDMVDGFMKTVPEAMFTLFQCLTLDSWTWFSRELQKDQPFVGVLWLLYVAVACMVLNNLVIAVIVNNAIARAEEDEELQASIARETTEGELNDLRQLFDELVPEADRDYMTQEEYEDAVEKQNETLWTKLKLNNLEEDEIMNLWTYMDWEEHIDREEFAQQIRNLKGECKAKHSYTVAMNLKKLDARLIQAKNYLETHKSLCEALKKETTQAQLELSRALHETRQFLLLTRRCIPGGQIPATASTQRRIEGFQGEVAKKVQPLLTPMMDLQEDTDETFRAQLVKMREQEGFSLPGEIDDSQAAQAFVPPMG
ncbi:Cation channel sperm-associated protein 1 (CatSper1) [Durusdinium trenchii]|uniref:Cation channel sperm-associated protein 1 (CatSper1) n=1 Tax=Durusdinium trenchii TaxID=1381693 RepID=A0ABP0Q423_9DINO